LDEDHDHHLQYDDDAADSQGINSNNHEELEFNPEENEQAYFNEDEDTNNYQQDDELAAFDSHRSFGEHDVDDLQYQQEQDFQGDGLVHDFEDGDLEIDHSH